MKLTCPAGTHSWTSLLSLGNTYAESILDLSVYLIIYDYKQNDTVASKEISEVDFEQLKKELEEQWSKEYPNKKVPFGFKFNDTLSKIESIQKKVIDATKKIPLDSIKEKIVDVTKKLPKTLSNDNTSLTKTINYG